MLDLSTWLLFLSAAFALAFAPGPGMLYVLSRTMTGGKSAGLASTFGASVGGLLHVFAAALGVSAILATSALAFSLVKWIGAAFLIFLGLKMLYCAYKGDLQNLAKESKTAAGARTQSNFKSAFLQGILAEALNPKTAIFFLAFIPQFVQPETGSVFSQFVVLGVLVVAINAIPDFLIVGFSKPVEKLWNSSYRFRITQQSISGSCLMGLGAYLALSDNSSVSEKS
ncbi:MAG: hypothetical protein OFPI_14100 [Osedax symbiont Rs2]|nr:MAG: hypothetical protein OFPI_14100 [Osedax symbiont Rs2]